MIINKTQSNLNNINFIDIVNPIKLQHPSRRIQILEHAKAMKLLNSYRKIPQLATELQSPIVVNSIKLRKDSNYSIQQSIQEKLPIKIEPEPNLNNLPQIPLTVMSQSMKVNETSRNSHSVQSPQNADTKRSLFRPQLKPTNNNQNSNSTTTSSKDTSQNIGQIVFNKNIIYSYCGKPRKRKLEVSAKSFIVFDQIENKIISQRKCNKRLEIASLTKIMTFYITLVTLEKYKLHPKDVKIKVTKKASETIGTSAELRYNDILSIEDLLYGLMLPSGNDAAVLIAQAIGTIILFDQIDKRLDISSIDVEQLSAEGHYYNCEIRSHQCPIEVFIEKMNHYSFMIGQQNTQFACVHGLANEDNVISLLQQYSTCNDIVLLSAECLKFVLFKQVVACKEYISRTGSKQYEWKNTNKLLDKGFIGIKTGITDSAGPCLASAYRISDQEQYLIVVLNCKSLQSRFDESITLLQHAKNKKTMNSIIQ